MVNPNSALLFPHCSVFPVLRGLRSRFGGSKNMDSFQCRAVVLSGLAGEPPPLRSLWVLTLGAGKLTS